MKAVVFAVLFLTILLSSVFHPLMSNMNIDYNKITFRYTCAGAGSEFSSPGPSGMVKLRYEVVPNNPLEEYVPANPETLDQYSFENAVCSVESVKVKAKFRDGEWRVVSLEPVSCNVTELRYECYTKAPNPGLCNYYFFAGGECYRCNIRGWIEILAKLPEDVRDWDVKLRDLSATITVPRRFQPPKIPGNLWEQIEFNTYFHFINLPSLNPALNS